MSRILEKLYASLALGCALAIGIIIWYHGSRVTHSDYWPPFFTFLHVISAITWIGLLYYFNFVQIRKMPEVPNELKPAGSSAPAPNYPQGSAGSATKTTPTGTPAATGSGAGGPT